MFPAATKAGGMLVASVPDVCLVPAPPAPPIPTPFPNMAQCATANPATCSLMVKILNMPVLHKGTLIPMTTGDEAGVGGGVVSGMFAQQACYAMGNPMVIIEGNPLVRSMDPTQHNGASPNAPVGMHAAPSQTLVLA